LKFTPEKERFLFSSGSDPNDFTSETLTKLKSDEILSVYIQDNGIGISEDNKKKLFHSSRLIVLLIASMVARD
jgi:signal transduction histidine kinase